MLLEPNSEDIGDWFWEITSSSTTMAIRRVSHHWIGQQLVVSHAIWWGIQRSKVAVIIHGASIWVIRGLIITLIVKRRLVISSIRHQVRIVSRGRIDLRSPPSSIAIIQRTFLSQVHVSIQRGIVGRKWNMTAVVTIRADDWRSQRRIILTGKRRLSWSGHGRILILRRVGPRWAILSRSSVLGGNSMTGCHGVHLQLVSVVGRIWHGIALRCYWSRNGCSWNRSRLLRAQIWHLNRSMTGHVDIIASRVMSIRSHGRNDLGTDN